MKTTIQKLFAITLLASATLLIAIYIPQQDVEKQQPGPIYENGKTPADRAENAQDRRDHFFRLTRNPKTNKIPDNIRAKEIEFAKGLEGSYKLKSTQLMEEIDIVEAGPNDVGGRTRALGIDPRDSNIILAGGASGGMWKSTDRGVTWTQTSDLGENLGITSLVQDPLNLDTWYYSTGEFSGASSRARGGGGQLYGSGIYVSNDNGDSWAQIASTNDDDVSFNSEFDFISRVEISPITGTQFFTSNALGIYRSNNGFLTSNRVLGGTNHHIYSDVQATSDGTIIAAISSPFDGFTATNSPGVYISTDDGLNWTNITPGTYPTDLGRAVIGTSKDNPGIFFVFAADNPNRPTLFRFDISDTNNITSSDRTENIPNFGDPVGSLDLQGGYNMVCAVHPTDSDIVLIGGTNLFRSLDGFSTKPIDNVNSDGSPGSDGITDDSEKNKFWIGGYASVNNISQYDNHHPDNHVVIFDPLAPDTIISSHDGGLSELLNIDTSSEANWIDLNNGYNITQFYTVTLHPDAGDTRVLGGTQDNGSPFFEYSTLTGTSASSDASSGDGSYAYLGTNYLTTSSQRGRLLQFNYDDLTGDPTWNGYIAPINATGELFIHPYLVNHNNEDIIFFPGGNELFRNNIATGLTPNFSNSSGTAEGWTELTDFATRDGSLISTLAISTTNPSDVLYYAEYTSNLSPLIYKLSNASTTTSDTDLELISIFNANSDSVPPPGSYIHDIAISEDNGNELLVVISNYGTESIYYSTNGGNTWTGSGGNLEPTNGNGPSVRTAAITKTDSGEKTYYVGTSTGLYATNVMNGASTEWKFQGANTVGNTVVEYLDYRTSDKTLAIATHGRGIFLGNVSTSVSNEDELVSNIPEQFSLEQNYPNPFNPSTNISYTLPASSNVSITVYDINGRKVANLLNGASQSAGSHELRFDATNLASGVYLYRIDAKSVSQNRSFSQIKRMTLIK